MKKYKIKYYSLTLILIILSISIIGVNYLYSETNKIKSELDYNIRVQQKNINNRRYLVTALQATEGIIETEIYNEIDRINSHLPDILVNDDYMVDSNLSWQYQKFTQLLKQYLDKASTSEYSYHELKNILLIKSTAIKSELEVILRKNQQHQQQFITKYNAVQKDLDSLFDTSLALGILVLLALCYLLSSIKSDNKFTLRNLADETSSYKIIKDNIRENAIIMEHACQRLSYHNAVVQKQLQQQSALIKQIQKDNYFIQNIFNRLNSTSTDPKQSFKLYAQAADMNNNIKHLIGELDKENKSSLQQLAKNTKSIGSIFTASQNMAVSVNKTEQEIVKDYS